MRSSELRRIFPLYFVLFGLLMVLVFSSGCGSKNPALTSAKIYMDLTPPDYNSAMEQLLIAVQKDSLSGEAHLLLARIYGEKKMYPQMQAELEKTERCKLKPPQADELKKLKAQLWIEVFNSGIHLGRDSRQVEGYRLNLLTDFTSYPQYKDSLKIISTKVDGTGKLTWDAYTNYGEAKPALEQLQRTLNQTAVERYLLALQIDSSRYEPYINLAADCVHKEETEKALEYYQKAYQLKPDDSNVMNDYAITLLSAKKYEEALALYERILQKDPANVNALVNLAMIYAQKGETGKSLDTYSKIISIDPEYMDAYFNRGLLYLSQAQGKMPALKAYIDSVKNNRKNKELQSRYQTVWGEYDRLFLKAEADFRKAGEIDPGDREAFFHLGLLYVGRAQIQTEDKRQSEDFVQAEEFFKKSMELNQEDTESMRYLGFTYLRLKRWQDATSPLEKLIDLDPTDREAWGYLAIAYANLGKKKQAEDALKKSAR